MLQPINGNPVPCLWRAYGDGGVGTNNPLFGREDCSFNVGGLSADTLINGASSSTTTTTSSSSQIYHHDHVHESSLLPKDNVSLALHL